jgi:hypothetical protein
MYHPSNTQVIVDYNAVADMLVDYYQHPRPKRDVSEILDYRIEHVFSKHMKPLLDGWKQNEEKLNKMKEVTNEEAHTGS